MLKDKDSKQSIQVTIRVRPLSQKQIYEDSRVCVKLEQTNSLHLNLGNQVKKFTFDSICFNQSQQQIFNRVGRKCTVDCLEGYNCTIFAYGQTGAGKTYTMMGVNFENESYYQQRGLIPRTMQFLFECIDRQRENGVNFIIRCSFLEIYNQQIIDLLNKSNNNLQLREDTRKGVYVQGITEEIINRSQEAMEILYKGSKSRHVGSTFYNQTSSRSHSVFTMQIESKYTKNGVSNTKSRQFNFIDLAGSERTKQSTGQRLKQGCNINKSLMNLASVINALSEVSQGKMQHVNYRNSKLTFLLKDSLGGNSKTNLIANISPATVFYQETLSTLGFARRAKLIKRQKASINQDSSGNLQSMKNEIKRLKQQVISLMSRQTVADPNQSNQTQKPSEMTSIMHQYVQEEIDKQTKLELQIIKLNDRIVQLQNGIKQYSNNEIHLRMIITVYQDKINRLKTIEKILNQNIGNLNQNDDQAKVIVSYFKNQRNDFIKELQNLRNQAENNKFLKSLLQQAKVIKQEGEDDSLKELLVKNTNFLNMIRTKLDDMKPQKIEFEFHSEYQKKMNMMQEQYSKRQQEYQQRVQQMNLQLTDFKSRNQQNQKLLEQAINQQIILEESINQHQQINSKLKNQLQQCKQRHKSQLKQKQNAMIKSESALAELKCSVTERDDKIAMLRKENDYLKAKLEKCNANQNALKEQFQNLQEEKYKIDKILLQNIEDLKEFKNNLLKKQSEISLLSSKIAELISQKQKIQTENIKMHEIAVQREKNFKNQIKQIEQQHSASIQSKMSQCEDLKNKIVNFEESIKKLNDKLSTSTLQLQTLNHQLSNVEHQHKTILANKQQKLKQLIELIKEKEVNGNQKTAQLNQAKIDLINSNSLRQQIEAKFIQVTDQLKEKVYKEQVNARHLQQKLKQAEQLYDSLNLQHQQQKKQYNETNQALTKTHTKMNSMQALLKKGQQQMQELNKQAEILRNKQKQLKQNILQIKNELFVTQSNSLIQLDALKSQIALKNQQMEQMQKQHTKSKLRYESNLEQLSKQIKNNLEAYKNEEQSSKKLMESHLQVKQKKITQLKQSLFESQSKTKELQAKIAELTQQMTSALQLSQSSSQQIINLEKSLQQQTSNIIQLQTQMNELKAIHQRQMEQNQMIHNEQIDQKNQKIEAFMLEQEQLNTQINEVRAQLNNTKEINKSLINQINTKNENYKQLSQEYSHTQNELSECKKQASIFRQQKQEQISKITQTYQQRQKVRGQELNQLAVMKQSIENRLHQQIQSKNFALLQHQEQLQHAKGQINKYISTISLLTQQNCSLNQQLTTQYNQKITQQQSIATLQASSNQIRLTLQTENANLLNTHNQTKKQLQKIMRAEAQYRQMEQQLKHQIQQLNKSLQSEHLACAHMRATNNSLQQHINKLQADLKQKTEQISSLRLQLDENNSRKAMQLNKMLEKYQKEVKNYQQLDQKYGQLQGQWGTLSTKLSQANEQLQSVQKLLTESKQREQCQIQKRRAQANAHNEQVKRQSEQLAALQASLKEATLENAASKEKINKYQLHNQKVSAELQELYSAKQKWQLQKNQMQRIRSHLEEQRVSKERIYNQLCRQKDNCNNLKMLIENKSAQNLQLEQELEQKDTIYKKLVEKIAKNESQNKKTTNSEHYLKTIELLEKSRAEQIELRRQNQELKKVMMTMKESIEQKQAAAREVEQRSETYCVSMHKRLEEIQNDYVQLQRNHEKVIKERKLYSYENQQLKEEIKILKASLLKMNQKNEEMEAKMKKANLDYIHLEKQFQQLKKNDSIIPINNDEKTQYINRLKAQVAALKTEKVLLTETLNKQRQEKTKLKAEMRYGKDGNNDLPMKLQLEKKINENKNLTQLIFEIISQLKICVNQPKAKLEVIRSIILGAIKQKNTQIKALKEKIKECQTEHYRQIPKVDYNVRQNRQIKALSISNANRHPQESYKFQKQKDPTALTNSSRHKMKQIQKYYAKLKYNDGENKQKGKNI